ncbi:MAG: 30S ribosomal protein S18 [Anaerolineae bacterium]|nr:30S ribosomal protein S18 [Anaerolineae bacterium]
MAEQGRRGRTGDQRRGKHRFTKRRKDCIFCKGKATDIDYKRTNVLRGFLTDRGKIRPRRQTGTCAKHQRQLSVAIKRARHLALLPFVIDPARTR